MKIHLTLAGLRRGGAERQAVTLAKGLKSRGHEVSVSVGYSGDYYETQLKQMGVPVIPLHPGCRPENPRPIEQALQTMRRFFSLVRLARKEHFDIIQSYGRTAGVYAWPLRYLTRSKTVFGVRGSAIVANPAFRFLQSKAANAAALVISNSDAGRDVVIEEGVDPERIVVIENGIDIDRFVIDPTWHKEIRAEFGVADDEHLVGIVARLNRVKDHETFLSAASKMVAEQAKFRFLVVGHDDPPRLQHLQALASDLGLGDHVIWAGVRDDVERVLNGMDICVLCSLTEGFPNVVAEAMACGVPCVVTDAGDAAKIVGSLGKVVPRQDAEGLADGIRQVIRDRDHFPSAALREQIVSEWSVENLVERTEQAYHGLLSDRR